VAGSSENDSIVTNERESRRNMDIPPPGMIDHSGPKLYKPSGYRIYGRLDTLKTISNVVSKYFFKITSKTVELLARLSEKSNSDTFLKISVNNIDFPVKWWFQFRYLTETVALGGGPTL
jgi:hypothetical protein